MSLADQKKFFLKTLFIVCVIGLVAIYGYLKMKNLIVGPVISVESPSNGALMSKGTVQILGTAQNITSLSLNDRPISINKEGGFSETIVILPGYNVLSLKGEDKFGKKTEKVLQLVLEE